MQHHFDVEIAKRYGMIEAILLNHFEYWIELNRTNEKNFFEGRYWTFNSMKALKEIFPYLSEKRIRNALKHLQEEGLILTGNFNKVSYDRTLWYTFSDLAVSILPKGQMDLPKKANGFTEKGEPIPDNNPDNNSDKNKYSTWKEFSNGNEELLEACKAFEEMRKKIKKPLTDRARAGIQKKLQELSSHVRDKERYMIAVLDRSTESCWQGVFKLDDFRDSKVEVEIVDDPIIVPEDLKDWRDLVP